MTPLISFFQKQQILITDIVFFCIVDTSRTIDYRQIVVTAQHILLIVDDVGQDWRELGVSLKLPIPVIGHINADNENVRDKVWEVCLQWKQRQGSKAMLGVLTDALENIGKRISARKLLGKVEPHITARYYGLYILAMQNGQPFPYNNHH